MAASRLIMGDFFERYEDILLRAGLTITLLKVYVDDGCQVTSLLRPGMRYRKETNSFEWDQDAEEEDRRQEGEKKDTFMSRLCLPIEQRV